MSTTRLRARAPSARSCGVASLPFHVLSFHKRGKDGSGKADAHFTARSTDVVYGVLFDLTSKDVQRLDAHEGRGYERISRDVLREDGTAESAFVYLARANSIGVSLRPTSAYLAYIIAGAREHKLPEEYVSALERTRAVDS